MDAVGRNLTQIYLKPLRALKNSISNVLGKLKPVLDGLILTVEAIRDGILAIGQYNTRI